MSEPKRILDEDGPGADLLRAARAYRPPSGSRERTLAAVGIVGVGAALGGAGAAKGAGLMSALKALAATKTGAVLLFVGVGTVASTGVALGVAASSRTPLEAVRATSSSSATPTATERSSAAAAAPKAASPPSASVEPSVEPEIPPVAVAEPAPAAQAAAPTATVAASPAPLHRAAPSSSTTAEGSLREELALLDRARAAQRLHDTRVSLAALDEHDRRFPNGQLSVQSQVLRIEVLADSGDRPGARRLAEAFLARHPGNVLAPRVRAMREALE